MVRIKNVVVSVYDGKITPIRIPEGVKLTIRDIDRGKRIEYISK